MIPKIYYRLGVEKDGVYVTYTNDGKRRYNRRIKSQNDLLAFLRRRVKRFGLAVDSLIVMASSSMDFPDEYTNRKKVIALAHELR